MIKAFLNRLSFWREVFSPDFYQNLQEVVDEQVYHARLQTFRQAVEECDRVLDETDLTKQDRACVRRVKDRILERLDAL